MILFYNDNTKKNTSCVKSGYEISNSCTMAWRIWERCLHFLVIEFSSPKIGIRLDSL